MKTYKYLMTLKPLEPFFFGGEYTFGADDNRGEASRYSAKSTYFPQQTALLGMLRKTMLIQNGNLTMHKKGEWVDSKGKGNVSKNYDEAVALVGSRPFSYESEIDLGIIKAISPVFIKSDNDFFIVNAKDHTYKVEELSSSMLIQNNTIQNTIIFEGFDTKDYKDDEFISQSGTIKSFSDFYKDVFTIGIKKSNNGAAEENAFFQKTSYSFHNKETFAVIVSLSEQLTWDHAQVTLGADQSSFMLEIKESPKDFSSMFENIYAEKQISRMILTSEAYIDKKAHEHIKFVFGNRKPYRQLIDAKHGYKSKRRYYLLERGSILYSDNIEALEEQINKSHLQQAGINHYIIKKGTKNV